MMRDDSHTRGGASSLRSFCPAIVVALAIGVIASARAQEPKPAAMSFAQSAQRRFPQPVRVGDLLKRQVLAPQESQPTLGWVRGLVRQSDGSIDVIVDYGAYVRYVTRPIAVPLDAMTVLGEYMEIVDLKPAQLDALPTDDGTGGVSLPPDAIVRVGLARPAH